MEECIVWERCPPDRILIGTGYGDGSGLNPKLEAIRRCGWGLVVWTPLGGISACAHGPLPGWTQDVPLAESYAFLIYLRFIGPTTDVNVATDCFCAGCIFERPGFVFRLFFNICGSLEEYLGFCR